MFYVFLHAFRLGVFPLTPFLRENRQIPVFSRPLRLTPGPRFVFRTGKLCCSCPEQAALRPLLTHWVDVWPRPVIHSSSVFLTYFGHKKMLKSCLVCPITVRCSADRRKKQSKPKNLTLYCSQSLILALQLPHWSLYAPF